MSNNGGSNTGIHVDGTNVNMIGGILLVLSWETVKNPKFCSQYRPFSEVNSVPYLANTYRKQDCATSDEIITLACWWTYTTICGACSCTGFQPQILRVAGLGHKVHLTLLVRISQSVMGLNPLANTPQGWKGKI